MADDGRQVGEERLVVDYVLVRPCLERRKRRSPVLRCHDDYRCRQSETADIAHKGGTVLILDLSFNKKGSEIQVLGYPQPRVGEASCPSDCDILRKTAKRVGGSLRIVSFVRRIENFHAGTRSDWR